MGVNTREKKIDLPPKGNRNADPITDAPGRTPSKPGSERRSPGPPAVWPSARSRGLSLPPSARPWAPWSGATPARGSAR